MTKSELARKLGVTYQTINNRQKRGELKAKKVNSRRSEIIDDTEEIVENSKAQSSLHDMHKKAQIKKTLADIAWREQKLAEHEQRLKDSIHSEYNAILLDWAAQVRAWFRKNKIGKEAKTAYLLMAKRIDKRIGRLQDGTSEQEDI